MNIKGSDQSSEHVLRPIIPPDGDVASVLEAAGLGEGGTPLRLHLGCGEVRLEGYINIDFPPSEHTVQRTIAADVFADILHLQFRAGSVDEIRLHHVFEHFDRPTALALLSRWQGWLKVGGELVIETPDLDACTRLLRSRRYSYHQKQVVLRHLFGSHEAAWAVHWDGWYEEKYRRVLELLGYHRLRFEFASWKMTHNITVRASKQRVIPEPAQGGAVYSLLRDSLVDGSESEEKLWHLWCEKARELLPNAPRPLDG